jgi:hypothetical protein
MDVTGPARRQWFRDFYAGEDDPEADKFWQEQTGFWDKLSKVSSGLKIWLSRRSAFEFCAFAETLMRLPRTLSFEIIDVTDFEHLVPKSFGRPVATGILIPEELKRAYSSKRQSSVEEWTELLEDWIELKQQDAPVRVIKTLSIHSAGRDVFDQYLIRHITSQWRKGARIIGHAMDDCWQDGHLVGDLYLFDRLLDLADARRIELEGSGSMRDVEVRRFT